MKENKENVIEGINSINDELYDDMFLQELENRLETDPLISNGLLNLISTDVSSPEKIDFLCESCNSESIDIFMM